MLDLRFEDGHFVLLIQGPQGAQARLRLDQLSVERFCVACISLLEKHGSPHPEQSGHSEMLLDYVVETLATGVDGNGNNLIEAEFGNLRPLRLRFGDNLARLIVQSFSETLAAPADTRTANKPN